MSSKRVRFEDDEDFNTEGNQRCKKSVKIESVDEDPLCSKHTLESDEEIEEEERMLDVELNAIGQEPSGPDIFSGDIHITPFNMKDEMEQGFFDVNGCYHFDRKNEINDAWLDNIDWSDKTNLYSKSRDSTDSDDDNLAPDLEKDNNKLFIELSEILKPNETVIQCIKRFGGNKQISNRDRWKNKSKSVDGSKDAIMLDKVIDIANSLLSAGVHDIYDYNIDRIKSREQKICQWEYKYESSDQVEGPFTTEEMIELHLAKKLEDTHCRLLGSEVSEFQPTWRFDFDLYL
ncbi:hypothetical protein GJ496_009924 [Pomphorhynchus laevis]|nr:hypothetical protein GJ496_009924 [Pomphorhynchus laevis]